MVTAAVAALVALWLADATVFVIELVATLAFGFASYLADDANPLSGLRRVRESIVVIALFGVGLTLFRMIWHGDTLLDAMLIVGITTAAVGGLLWAIAMSSPNESVPVPLDVYRFGNPGVRRLGGTSSNRGGFSPLGVHGRHGSG